MLDFNYENQGVNTYLVYKIGCKESVDSLSLGMLTNNNIPGFANTLFTQMDEEKYIKYNVSAKISMKQFFSGVVNRKRLLGAFEGIVEGLMSAEDYMIDTSGIILNPEYIFVDVTSCVATLICLPITNIETSKPDLGAFFKNFMFTTQFDQTENCNYVAKIINFLNSSPVLSLTDFKKLLDDLKNENTQTKNQSVVNKPEQASKPQPVVRPTHSVVSQLKAAPIVSSVQSVQLSPQPTPQPDAATKKNMIVPPKAKETQDISAVPEKKQISMFELLMHYNKENKKLYEEQKAAKKAGNTTLTKQPATQQNKQLSANPSFAVPGVNQTPIVQKAVPAKPQGQPSIKQPSTVPQTVPQAIMSQPIRNKTYNSTIIPQGQSMNFGETTVLGGGLIGETTVLNGGIQQTHTVTPQLIRNKSNEKILLNKPIFRIGKEKSYVDYFISDNAAISRSHANVISRDGKYYIVDTNSTNHTYVDGSMIQSNLEVEISHGTKIRLANEDFVFNLY